VGTTLPTTAGCARERDPFAELDQALSNVRRCSREIAELVTADDPNRALNAWSHIRDEWSERVGELLLETRELLPEDCR